MACKRFLDDLKRKRWRYEYRADLADRAVRFQELMPHVKGRWAAKKQRLVYEPWQCFAECNLFGWVDKKTGLRRFREAYEEVPRKNAKSTRIAARGLYLFCADGENGAEVYSGATTEKQAYEVFRPAWMMAHRLKGLRDRFGVEQSGNPKNPGPMYVMEDMSRFEAMIGKPGDGSSPHAALIDEYHEHDTDQMVDAMQTGMGAREQPLLSIITTSGSNLSGPCYQKRQDVIRILEGTEHDDTVFGVIYGIDAPHEEIFDTSAALLRMDKDCTCGNVPAETVARLFAKACALHVTGSSQEQDGRPRRKGASTIRIGQSRAEGCAEDATSGFLSGAHRGTKSDKRPLPGDGSKETRSGHGPPRSGGAQSSPTKSGESTSEKRLSSLCTELTKLSTTVATPSKAGAAASAKSTARLYALITSTEPKKFEDCFAGNATLRLAFSETLKRVYEGHSNTCEVRSSTSLNESGLSITVKISGDSWDDPKSLVKANPNYGVSVFPAFLEAQLAAARRSASKQNAFRTKHLNEWVGARTVWMNMLSWQRQKKKLDISEFHGCPCWIAVDLASKKDVAALVMLFLKDDQFCVIPRFYAPEAAAEDNKRYLEFAGGGWMTLTPGTMTDYAFIEQEIQDIASVVDLQDAAFDDWQANYLMTRLADTSIKVVDYNQTVRNMSEPMKEVEARVLNRTLWHDGNPVMTWMMGNVSAKVDAKENIYPRKDNESDPRCKIDGPVALIMAMGRAMVNPLRDKVPLKMFVLG